MPELNPEEIRRYSRHLLLPEVGVEGQERLKGAKVLLVGAGGLGSPAGLYLAAAGVGTLGLVDFDVVDETNLQRQVLYGQQDLGRPKLEAARERLAGINPHIELRLHEARLTSENALEILGDYDLVVDGSDNFPTRYLVNDACVLLGKPDVYGSIFRFEGQVAVFWGAEGPCYRCLFPEPPPPGMVPSCAEGGVLGVLPGIIGSLQANEALKLILGAGEPATGRLVLFDALKLGFRELKLQKDPECPLCSAEPSQKELIDYEAFCAGADPDAPTEAGAEPREQDSTMETEIDIDVDRLRAWLDSETPPAILDVRTHQEVAIARIEGTVHIPVQELPSRLDDLREVPGLGNGRRLVVHCHHGPRSSQATAYLRSQGFDAYNLDGGIDAWSLAADPSVPRY